MNSKLSLFLLFLLPLLSFGQSNKGWTTDNFGNTFDGDNYIAFTLDKNEDFLLLFRTSNDGEAMFSISCYPQRQDCSIKNAKAFLFAVDEGQIYHFFHSKKIQGNQMGANFFYAHYKSDETFKDHTILTMSELAKMLQSGSKLEIRIIADDRNTDLTFDLTGSNSAINYVINSTDNYINEQYPILWGVAKMLEANQDLIYRNQFYALRILCEFTGVSYTGALLFYGIDDSRYETISLVDTNEVYPEINFDVQLVNALTRLIRPTQQDHNRSIYEKEADLIKVAKYFKFYNTRDMRVDTFATLEDLKNNWNDLYNLYVESGLITMERTSFEKFSKATAEQQSKLYDLGCEAGIFNKVDLHYRVSRLNQIRKEFGIYTEGDDWWESDENFFKSFGLAP